MDWSNELYVKVYRRDTADDLLLSWEARALWHEMLRKFDRSGIIKARRGAQGLAALVRIPVEVVENALAELLDDGRVQTTDGGWVAPNYMEAQEATKAHALRQREYRERERRKAISQSSDTPLRESDETRRDGDTNGQTVTQSDSDLIRSEPNRSDLSRGARARDLLFPAEYERRRIPEDPGVFMVLDSIGKYLGSVRIREDGSEEAVES